MAGRQRVVRGPDWKYGDEDGGEGSVGTVQEYKRQKDGVVVLWDNGHEGNYRAGGESRKYDLRIFDNGPTDVTHKGSSCHSCNEKDIKGMRWKCNECHHYDLCTLCYGNGDHDISHSFKRFIKPEDKQGTTVNARKKATAVTSVGCFKGAQVECLNGLKKGERGEVVKRGYGPDGRPAVEILWHDKKRPEGYPLSGRGRVILKYIIPAKGWIYFVEHLPVLDYDLELLQHESEEEDSDSEMEKLIGGLLLSHLMKPEEVLEEVLKKHAVALAKAAKLLSSSDSDEEKQAAHSRDIGRFVYIGISQRDMKRYQEGHGGWHEDMNKIFGAVGIIRSVDRDSDLFVYFGGDLWKIHAKAVTYVDMKKLLGDNSPEMELKLLEINHVTTGSVVRLADDENIVKTCLADQTPWKESLTSLLGQFGLVIGQDERQVIKVCFGKNILLVHCNALKAYSIHVPVEDDKATDEEEPLQPSFKIGDIVRVISDTEKIKRLQEGHGGFVSDMAKYAGVVGLVENIDGDGDIRLCHGEKTYCWNPAALRRDEDSLAKLEKISEKGVNDVNNNEFELGQLVVLINDENRVRVLQKDRGGWLDVMQKVLGKCGIVVKQHDAKVRVCFGKNSWWFNPLLLIPLNISEADNRQSPNTTATYLPVDAGLQRSVSVGDIVKLCSDISTVQHYQEGHGGWNDKMKNILGKIGIIKYVDNDNDVYACFDDEAASWCLNRDVITLLHKAGTTSGQKLLFEDYDSIAERGSLVKLSAELESVMYRQSGHGGWNNKMRDVIGELGIVCKRPKKDVVKVCFGIDTWHINIDNLIPWVLSAGNQKVTTAS